MREGISRTLTGVTFVSIGLEDHLKAIDSSVAPERANTAALLFEGPSGIGKSSLWSEGVRRAEAAGCLVLSCRGAQTEVRLAFAGLTDLLSPIPSERFESLSTPQSSALEAALLRAPSVAAPDLRTIGMAITSLLTQEAERRRVVIALDDLQWLDRSSFLAVEFALRRLANSRITVLATSRRMNPTTLLGALVSWTDVRLIELGPATMAALDAIVSPVVPVALTRSTIKRLWTASGGSPFAAMEMIRSGRDANEIELLQSLVPHDVRDIVDSRLRDLPEQTRDELLLMAATAPATSAPLDLGKLAPAFGRGLIAETPAGQPEFVHPLYRAAVLVLASPEMRRAAHQRLAALSSDLDAKARHLALADDAASEDVANALEAAGDRALLRGALDDAADFFELSANRTPADGFETGLTRLLRAAHVRLTLSDTAEVQRLAGAVVRAEPSSDLVAQAQLIEGEALSGSRPDHTFTLLTSSLPLATTSRTRAKVLVGLGAMNLYRLDFATALEVISEAIDLAETLGLDELLAQGLATRQLARIMLGLGFDAVELDRALALEEPAGRCYFQSRPATAGARVFEFTGQHVRARTLLESTAVTLRRLGEELEMPFVLSHLAATSLLSGDLVLCDREATAASELAQQLDQPAISSLALSLRAAGAAMRGDRNRALSDGLSSIEYAEASDWPWSDALVRWARALVALAEDDPLGVLRELDVVVAGVERLGVFEMPMALPIPDVIEALVATGDLVWATRLADKLVGWGASFDRQWARAVGLRCQALVASAEGRIDDATRLGTAAIAEHEGLPMAWDLGRTLLAVGQVRRRAGERRLARDALESAKEIFERIGAAPWAEKARAEFARIGVRRAPETLTENERRVCELAAVGEHNPTIAARLFISVRTVEANLSRGYRKLGITNRAQLGVALARESAD